MKAGVSGTASSSASASAYSCAALTSAPPPPWHRWASAPRKRRASACARGTPAGHVSTGGEARGASPPACGQGHPASAFPRSPSLCRIPNTRCIHMRGTPTEGTSGSQTLSTEQAARRRLRGTHEGGRRARAPACPGRPRAGRRARPPRRPGARPAGRRSSGRPRPRRRPWRDTRSGQRRQRRVWVSASGSAQCSGQRAWVSAASRPIGSMRTRKSMRASACATATLPFSATCTAQR